MGRRVCAFLVWELGEPDAEHPANGVEWGEGAEGDWHLVDPSVMGYCHRVTIGSNPDSQIGRTITLFTLAVRVVVVVVVVDASVVTSTAEQNSIQT